MTYLQLIILINLVSYKLLSYCKNYTNNKWYDYNDETMERYCYSFSFLQGHYYLFI